MSINKTEEALSREERQARIREVCGFMYCTSRKAWATLRGCRWDVQKAVEELKVQEEAILEEVTAL